MCAHAHAHAHMHTHTHTHRIKGIQIREEEVKLYLFVEGMILYIENPEESKKKKTKLLNQTKSV